MGCFGRLARKIGCGCLTLVVAGSAVLYFTGWGHAIGVAWRNGFLSGVLGGDAEDRKYNASSQGNLKALYTAIMLYHESEGQFPMGKGWMDAIEPRIKHADMAKSEAEKKLISPSLAGKQGQFGYALNDAVAGKYKGDIKDKKTPLIFDSSDTSRNAHGDPKKLLPHPPRPGGNLAIAVDGTILKL